VPLISAISNKNREIINVSSFITNAKGTHHHKKCCYALIFANAFPSLPFLSANLRNTQTFIHRFKNLTIHQRQVYTAAFRSNLFNEKFVNSETEIVPTDPTSICQ